MSNLEVIKCPICYASIETSKKTVEVCPACHESIKDKLEELKDQNQGLTTARTKGTNLKPMKDLSQDVY